MQQHLDQAFSARGAGAQWRPVVALALALALVACGGGGGGTSAPSGGGTGSGSGSGSGSGNPPPSPSARATLVVTVVDAFGIPVSEADVNYYVGSGGTVTVYGSTNSEGAVTLDVPAGAGRVVARGVLGRQEAKVDLARNARAELRLSLVPQGDTAFAVLKAEIVPGSVADDGRSLELRIAIASAAGQLYSWSFDPHACAARADGDLAALGPACLDSGDGTDHSWNQVGELELGKSVVESGVPAGPVLVLLDRSQRSGDIDRHEEHLFAAKALVAGLLDGHSVAVGAFAGDGGPTGTASPLPEKPVTFYPVENPGWITSRSVAFEALESLRGRSGGSAPLAAAIESGIDFLLARTDASERPALVVLTAGGSEGCSYDQSPGPGATSQCAAIRAAAQRARQVGVTVWLVGPGDAWYPSYSSWDSPGSLVSAAREAPAWWAAAVMEGDVYAASLIARKVLSGAPAVREVRFRISIDGEGTFAPGAEVRGDLRIVDAGWSYWAQRLPFRATVPAPAG